ncbi:hypothetical protein BX666DRAFT_1894714 [Dichotomocladium elegans]|nr:hypothetical protein BX666DRAFT_1894714 [Dichotomocladium elegans]
MRFHSAAYYEFNVLHFARGASQATRLRPPRSPKQHILSLNFLEQLTFFVFFFVSLPGTQETTFIMHPPLAQHKHQGCLEAIEALEECHRAGFLNKFSGACNAKKQALDQCLKEEFLADRAENKHKSYEKRKRMEKIWKDMEEPPTAGSR